MAGCSQSPPSADRIIERLIELGLDEGEARAFVHVSAMGPSKAGEIARALRVPRGEAYRVLQKLVEREFVTPSLSRPVEFRAVAVDQLFEDVLQQERRRITRIEESKLEIRDALARMQAADAEEPTVASFSLVHGRRKILALADRMFAGCSDAVIIAAHPAARTWIANWPAQRPQATARVLCREVARNMAPGASSRRLASDTPVGLLIVDTREVLVWITHDQSERLNAEGDVAFLSTSPDLVALHTMLFDALWSNAASRE